MYLSVHLLELSELIKNKYNINKPSGNKTVLSSNEGGQGAHEGGQTGEKGRKEKRGFELPVKTLLKKGRREKMWC